MPDADPVAVVGMGAVGTLLPGALASAGHPILAGGRAPLASITVAGGTGSTSCPVTWTDQPGDLRGIRWTVLATNVHDTVAAAGWLAALSPGQYLLAAQDGVGHGTRLAPLTGATVVRVLVYVNAARAGPGRVRARGTTLTLKQDLKKLAPDYPGIREPAFTNQLEPSDLCGNSRVDIYDGRHGRPLASKSKFDDFTLFLRTVTGDTSPASTTPRLKQALLQPARSGFGPFCPAWERTDP